MKLYRGLDQLPKINTLEEINSLEIHLPKIIEALTDYKIQMFDEKRQIRPEFYQEIGAIIGESEDTVKEIYNLWGNSRSQLSFSDSKEMALRYAGDDGYVIVIEVDQEFAIDHLDSFTLSMEGESYLLTSTELANLRKEGKVKIQTASEIMNEDQENTREFKPPEDFKPFRGFRI